MEDNSSLIHILHIQESLDVGGLENGVINVSNHLNKDIFKTTICCINRLGKLAERINNPNVACFSLAQGEGRKFLLPFRLRRLMLEHKVDIVHTHNYYSGFYGIIAAKLSGGQIKVVHGEHGMAQYNRKRRKLISRSIYPLADRIVTMSKDQENFLRILGIQGEKIVTILNGVDLNRFHQAVDVEGKREELGLGGADAVIGCVGRLALEKGHRYLIGALKTLSLKMPEVHLVLVGDGPIRYMLEDYAVELKLRDRVHFFGTRDNVNEVYPLFDVFCLPSLTEGLPNALLEAMAARLPVVATSVGGNLELLTHMENGVLVPPKSASSLAEAITYLLLNPSLKQELAEKGHRFVEERFSLSRMVNDYTELYLNLQSTRTKRG